MSEQVSNEVPQGLVSVEDMRRIMNEEGNTVKAVLLKADGTMEEVNYNSTPKVRHVETFIEGSPTILGQYPELDVILVKNIDETNKELTLNKHKLKSPFHNLKIKGNIFLYRFNKDCKVVDFTLTEYKEFLLKKQDINEYENELDNNNNDDINDDCNEEENEIDTVKEMLKPIVRKKFIQQNGREPSEDEFNEVMKAALNKLGINENDNDDDDDDEDYNPAEDEEEEDDDDYDDDDDLVNDNDEEKANDDKTNGDNDEEEIKITKEQMDEVKALMSQLGARKRLELQGLIRDKYKSEIGEELNEEELQKAFNNFNLNIDNNNNLNDNKECIIDENIKKDYEEALENVKLLGREHGKKLMNNIYKKLEENGIEPTIDAVKETIGEIKQHFINETKDEFINELDNNNIELNNAKNIIYNDLKDKALKQWISINGNKIPNNNDINETIRILSYNYFDDYLFEKEEKDDDNNDDEYIPTKEEIDAMNNDDDDDDDDDNDNANNNNNNNDNSDNFDDEKKEINNLSKFVKNNNETDSEYNPETDMNGDIYSKDEEDDENYNEFVTPLEQNPFTTI